MVFSTTFPKKLYKLHWLARGFQVQFKVLFNTYKTLHGTGLGYLQDGLSPIRACASTGYGLGYIQSRV